MSTNKELKQQVKEYLNGLGYNTKQNVMSISVKSAMYDTSIRIVIKVLSINEFEVSKEVHERFESIRYDEVCGEILCGGNTYVRVNYDYTKFKEEVGKYKALANQAVEKWKLNCEDYEGIAIAETEDKKLFMYYGCNGFCSISSKKNKYSMLECGRYTAHCIESVAEALYYFINFGTFKEETQC